MIRIFIFEMSMKRFTLQIPQYQKLTEIIHQEDCPVITQLALGAYYRKTGEQFLQVEPDHMMSSVTSREKQIIRDQMDRGDGNEMLPFPFMGWVDCIAATAWDWQFSRLLNNVHTYQMKNQEVADKIRDQLQKWS